MFVHLHCQDYLETKAVLDIQVNVNMMHHYSIGLLYSRLYREIINIIIISYNITVVNV